MKIIIDIEPVKNGWGGAASEDIREMHLTLPPSPSIEDMIHAFRAVLYAQTYHPDTIDEYIKTSDILDSEYIED